MELREMNVTTEEETAELLSSQRDDDDESYFIEYAIQKEIINRNRCTASRRLLGQTGYLDLSVNNTNHQSKKESPCAGISFIHGSGPNWPPSRKREEAKALENLRKRVEQSKLYKANQVSDPGGSSSTSARQNNEEVQQLDNRPQLFKKILSNRPMSIAHDSSDLETDWRDSEFITECLCWHNVYRQRHAGPPLTMSPQLCEYAQTWANHLAHTNTFYYRNDRDVGQNLYCRPGGAVTCDVAGQEVAAYWYSAVRQYDFLKEPDVLHANVNAGHFTQLIWANSRHFGVGKARSRSGKIIVVANYQPVGNISGQFQMNVHPPIPDCANLPLPPPPRVRQYETPMSDVSTSSNSSISTQ
ncbi:uncharacterized protein [Neodiprion pinetum]|uniref:uncharacterized protein isoform X1 n=1 Tax=Neodiprion pinetum TaxID=441929 RepID=UPI001EDF5940|nr:repressed by EFG1 protein 1-like [Neodiprion pinetum]